MHKLPVLEYLSVIFCLLVALEKNTTIFGLVFNAMLPSTCPRGPVCKALGRHVQ